MRHRRDRQNAGQRRATATERTKRGERSSLIGHMIINRKDCRPAFGLSMGHGECAKSELRPAHRKGNFSSPTSRTTFFSRTMATLAPSAIKQASRLASKSALTAAPRHGLQQLSRVASAPVQRTAGKKRSYVTESKRDNAQVQTETAIRLDRKELEKSGLTITSENGSTEHVSPMAGRSFPITTRYLGSSMLTLSSQMS